MPPELAAFLESGLVLVVGTVDGAGAPECTFAVGLRVHSGGRRATVFLAAEPAARTLQHLRGGGAVAITGSRPFDYRTIQLKGRAVGVREVPPEERPIVAACREAFAAQLEKVGWARSMMRRVSAWPCLAAEIELAAVFDQTPGPRAGSPVRSP